VGALVILDYGPHAASGHEAEHVYARERVERLTRHAGFDITRPEDPSSSLMPRAMAVDFRA